MRKPVFLLIFLLAAVAAIAQELEGPGALPIEINATGQTTYENGIATAHDNVAIHFGDADIYSDFAQYDTAKREVLLKGNVRIYRGVSLYLGESAIYNVDTKAIHAADMRSGNYPYLLGGQTITSESDQEYLVQHGTFTTHDSSQPDFHLNAKSVRIYENDRVIFKYVTLYIGKVPVFWWPYLYQSLDQAFSYAVVPAYLSSWGPSILSRITFPIGEKISSTVRFDYRSRRGEALGFDAEIRYGKEDRDSDEKGEQNVTKIRSYYLQDQNPELNRTSLPRGTIPTSRYRFSLADRTHFTEDLYATVDVTKLSDAFLLQDFFPGEFRVNPEPDNVVALTKEDPFYTITAFGRFQWNAFFETTERLPEIAIDIKRHGLFGGPIFYEGETSASELRRNFPANTPNEDYNVFRVDSFHQLTYPNTYFGWLSIVPRVGFRETYYSETRDLAKTIFTPDPNPFVPDFVLPNPTFAAPIEKGGPAFRTIVNAGVESSFKFSRTWEDVQSRFFGLDGLRHIVQPFANFSWVSEPTLAATEILQFDRFQPSTKLKPIDFPQYTSIDSIDNWTIARLGVRNRLQTRRDDLTVSWLEVETFLDVNIDNPFDDTQYSNVFNRLRFTPLPWATLVIDSQLPLLDKGFTEVNTSITFKPSANTTVTLGHRYLTDNPFFVNSSLFSVGGYYRINDNWGVSALEIYEADTDLLEQQRYSIYRDLTSWVASLGAIIQNNGGVKQYGVLLTFTLKAFPKFGFDLNFDPSALDQQQP